MVNQKRIFVLSCKACDLSAQEKKGSEIIENVSTVHSFLFFLQQKLRLEGRNRKETKSLTMNYYFFSLDLQPSAGYGLLVHEVS
jgi:hypothetical protein